MAKIKEKETEKDKALSQVLKDIEKQFGKGAIMKLGEQENAKLYLKNNPDVLESIENEVRDCYGIADKEKIRKSHKKEETIEETTE